jgi:adenylate cyclase
MSGFFSELRRRNVFRVGIAYLAVAWLVLQVAETLLPVYGFTDLAIRNLVVILVIGLLIALVLAWVFEWTPTGILKETAAGASAQPAGKNNTRLDQFIIVVLVIAIALFSVDKFVLDPARDAAKIEAASEKARADALVESFGDKSIAVLAFADMSPGGDQEYFSDGIAEELLNLLATIRELRVISRSTAFTFKGSNASLKEIAEKLDVAYILEGSVRKAGDRVRVTAQLIDARTDTHLWSETYDRNLDDVFAIQDEISNSIVEELRVTLLDDGPTSQRIDPRAYELYLKARHIVHTSNMSQLREAQSLLNEVLAIAPDYIPALNELARLYYRVPKTEGLSPEQNTAEIQALANRVIDIDPNGAAALIWQGWFAYMRNDLQEAANYYEKAMRVDPNDTNLLRVLVSFLTTINRPDEAIALGKYLLLRDPACAVCISNLAFAYRVTGRHEESAQTLESLLTWRAPVAYHYWSLGVSWLGVGNPEKALAAFEQESVGNLGEMGALMALHDLGRNEEFEARFTRFRNEVGDAESIARIYAWIGDNDKAYEWLDKMIAEEGPDLLEAIDTDLYAKIKSDPRWRLMRDKYGYFDTPVEAIDFTYSLPAGASLD